MVLSRRRETWRVHVDRAERLTRPREDLGELLDVLWRFRWRLAREQLLLFGLRGLIISCALLTVLSVTAWLVGTMLLTTTSAAAIAAVPLVALAAGLIRWPSAARAARAADHHLGLAERVATALELQTRGEMGRFDRLQVRDAIATARGSSGQWPSALHGTRSEGRLLALAL